MTHNWKLLINGEYREVSGDADTPLIWPLRNQLDLISVRFGCGGEDCGACRILVDDKPGWACSMTLQQAENSNIRTLEGILEELPMKKLQEAFLQWNAGQCGYCLSGILVTASHILTQYCIEKSRVPERAEIAQALDNHLCRCGAHNRIITAIESAASNLLESLPAHASLSENCR